MTGGRSWARGWLLAAILASGGGPPLAAGTVAMADVSANVTGLRSHKGMVLACLTSRPDAFPDCSADPAAHRLKVAAASPLVLDFGEVPAGRYAISLIHDENDNGRLDKRLMLPREGYGFSRNAPVRMGPPSFRSAAFDVTGASSGQTIAMRYIL